MFIIFKKGLQRLFQRVFSVEANTTEDIHFINASPNLNNKLHHKPAL